MSLVLFLVVAILAFPVIRILRKRGRPVTETMTLTTGRARRLPRRRTPIGRVVQPAAAILVAVALLGIPFLLTILTAAKTQAEAFVPSLALPTSGTSSTTSRRSSATGACSPRSAAASS